MRYLFLSSPFLFFFYFLSRSRFSHAFMYPPHLAHSQSITTVCCQPSWSNIFVCNRFPERQVVWISATTDIPARDSIILTGRCSLSLEPDVERELLLVCPRSERNRCATAKQTILIRSSALLSPDEPIGSIYQSKSDQRHRPHSVSSYSPFIN